MHFANFNCLPPLVVKFENCGFEPIHRPERLNECPPWRAKSANFKNQVFKRMQGRLNVPYPVNCRICYISASAGLISPRNGRIAVRRGSAKNAVSTRSRTAAPLTPLEMISLPVWQVPTVYRSSARCQVYEKDPEGPRGGPNRPNAKVKNVPPVLQMNHR